MTTTFFISETFIKRWSAVNGSVDSAFFLQALQLAHEKHMQSLLGTRLYLKMLTLVADGTITDVGNANYKLLIDKHLQMITLQWFLVEVLPWMQTKISNSTLIKPVPENHESLSPQEVSRMVNLHRNNAQQFSHTAIKWLCANASLLPEYGQWTQGEVRHITDAYKINI